MIRILSLALSLAILASPPAAGDIITVDFLEGAGMSVNAAGPVLVMVDGVRGRLIAANTLSSSLSLIDLASGDVRNIPLAGRAFQHLKAESMTLRRSTGHVGLIGIGCFHLVDTEKGTSLTVPTGRQLESIAIEEETGNVFLAGRESRDIFFYDAGKKTLKRVPWLETSEPLINLNATPPPPLRKVVCDPGLGRIVAVDGYTSTLWIFDAERGNVLKHREIPVTSGGRWHLGGYDVESHRLYLVIETSTREVIEAAMIDVTGGEDIVTPLPGYREGVGIVYNPARNEVYIPYDNAASVHVVDFGDGGKLYEIPIPAYGNDASAFDTERDLLFIGSWAHGEIDVIDLEKRRMIRRYPNLGLIPHMFTMAYDQENGRLYFPKGASAVNGTFGSAVSVFDPFTGEQAKIRTGWAPIDLIENPETGDFIVFNSEDRFAVVSGDGSFETRDLPFDYPVRAALSPENGIYLSYGPHQSYWPTVYIWDAKNGILLIDSDDYSFYDRRIPRQALAMASGHDGTLYFTQNNWGREEQFIGKLIDQVRLYEPGRRIRLQDEVEREITQRILEYDPGTGLLYLVKTGEKDDDQGTLYSVSPDSNRVLVKAQVGITPTDLVFDDETIYVSNFDSNAITSVTKGDTAGTEIPTDKGPLRMCFFDGRLYVINHIGRTVQELGETGTKLPFGGTPDNLFEWNGRLIISAHSEREFRLIAFDPRNGKFETLLKHEYPYGDTSFDTNNVSFYVRGQFGDAVFDLTKAVAGSDGDLRVIDFLAGKMFVISGD